MSFPVFSHHKLVISKLFDQVGMFCHFKAQMEELEVTEG